MTWQIASGLVGLVIGLFAGRYLNATVVFWENIESGSKGLRAGITILLGGGLAAGAALFAQIEANNAGIYLIGAAVGGLVAFFLPLPPSRLTPKQIESIALASLEVKKELAKNATIRQTVDLTTIRFVTAEKISEAENISMDALETRLADALDLMSEGEETV